MFSYSAYERLSWRYGTLRSCMINCASRKGKTTMASGGNDREWNRNPGGGQNHLCPKCKMPKVATTDCPYCFVFERDRGRPISEPHDWRQPETAVSALESLQELYSKVRECIKRIEDLALILEMEIRRYYRNLQRLREACCEFEKRNQQIRALQRASTDGRGCIKILLNGHTTIKSEYVYSKPHVGYKIRFVFESFIELHPVRTISVAVLAEIGEGEMDNLLYWPYKQKVVFTFLDFGNFNHVRKIFDLDAFDPGFLQPLRGSQGNRPVLCFTVPYSEIGHCKHVDRAHGTEYLHVLFEVDGSHPTRDDLRLCSQLN